MLSIVFSLIGLVGIVNIVTRSYLFEGVRNRIPAKWKMLRYFAQCPACFGTWVGFLYYLFAVCPFNSFYCFISFFLWGGAVSFLSASFVTLLDYLSYLKQESVLRIASSPVSSTEGEDE